MVPWETILISARPSDCKPPALYQSWVSLCCVSVVLFFLLKVRFLIDSYPMALHSQVIVREEAQAAWGWWERMCLCLRGKHTTFHACAQCLVTDYFI